MNARGRRVMRRLDKLLMSEVYVIAECVECGTKRKVRAGEVKGLDMPECENPGCYGICVAVGAERK